MGIKLNKKVLGLGVALVGMVFGATSALAAPFLTIADDQGNAITCTDQQACDSNAAVGTVSYAGSVGQWTITVAAGVDFYLNGASPTPHIDLVSLVSTGTLAPSPQTLTIEFSSQYNTGGNFQASIGGTTDGVVVASLLIDGSEVLSSGDITPFIFNAFAWGGSVAVEADGPYTLTERVAITHQSGSAVATSFDYEVKVPEPGILGLFGFGLLGMGIAARRRRVI